MSLVVYYCRLDEKKLPAVKKDPEILFQADTFRDGVFEIVDIDRMWEPLAWLLSDCKRAEQENLAANLDDALSKRNRVARPWYRRLFSKEQQSRSRIEESLERLGEIELDPLLAAIEGRVDDHQRIAEINYGCGPAALFSVSEVSALSAALQKVDANQLMIHYDAALMDQLYIFPECWVDEGEAILDQGVRPGLDSLKDFYFKAASRNQAVLVWLA